MKAAGRSGAAALASDGPAPRHPFRSHRFRDHALHGPRRQGWSRNEKLQRFLDHPLRQAELVALAKPAARGVSLEQLLGLGWTKGAGLERARAGHLHRIHLASTRAGTSHSRPLPIPRVRSPKLLSRSPCAPLGARWSNRDREPRAALLLPPPTRSRGWFSGRAGRPGRIQVPKTRWATDRRRSTLRGGPRSWTGPPTPARRIAPGWRELQTDLRGDRLDYGLAIDSLMNRARA